MQCLTAICLLGSLVERQLLSLLRWGIMQPCTHPLPCPALPHSDDTSFMRCHAISMTQDQASHVEDCCVGIRSGASDGEGSWHAVPSAVAGSRRAAGCRGGQEEQMGLCRGCCHEHAEGAGPHQQHQQEPLPQVAAASFCLLFAPQTACHSRNTTGVQI